jgi:hypothetical protein
MTDHLDRETSVSVDVTVTGLEAMRRKRSALGSFQLLRSRSKSNTRNRILGDPAPLK